MVSSYIPAILRHEEIKRRLGIKDEF